MKIESARVLVLNESLKAKLMLTAPEAFFNDDQRPVVKIKGEWNSKKMMNTKPEIILARFVQQFS